MSRFYLVIMPISIDNLRWCEKHGLPYRKNLGEWEVANLFLFQMLLDDERFMRLCGWDPETGYEHVITRANAAIQQVGPACCFLGDEVMEKILGECKR